MSFSPYNNQKLKYKSKPVHFSNHAKGELITANLSVYELIDMLNNPVPCPRGRRIKKIYFEICSNKNRKVFRIILYEDYCFDERTDCYLIIHIKPT